MISSKAYSPLDTAPPTSQRLDDGLIEVGRNRNPSTALNEGSHDYPPPAANPPHYPFVPRQTLIYLQYFTPFLLSFIFPMTFALYVHARGQVHAPLKLSKFTTTNPRITRQIITILASFLTATTKWSFSGAATLLARKRLLKPRPMFEIELFSNLKNVSVFWNWGHRKRITLLTWLLVVVCGLLTSGFVTLLNPLPISVTLQPALELDLAAQGDSCKEWYNQTINSIYPTSCDQELCKPFSTLYPFVKSDDILDFARTRIAQHYSTTDASQETIAATLTQALSGLDYIRVSGNTGGTLMTGPAGVRVNGFPDMPRLGGRFSYSLDLQGLWSDIPCSYDRNNALNVTWGSASSGTVVYTVACPGSSTVKAGTSKVYSGGYANVLAFSKCPTDGGGTALMFRFFQNATGPSDERGMDYLKCELGSKLGDVRAVLDPALQAFVTAERTPSGASAPAVAERLVKLASTFIEDALTANQQMHYTITDLMTKYSLQPVSTEAWQELMRLILQDVFDYQLSILRLMLTKYGQGVPPECQREVKIVVSDQVIGWEISATTALGLIPLLVVFMISLSGLVLALVGDGRLTLFDPTSPVSLIAATSVGNVVLPSETIGDAQDEQVLSTKVCYGQDGEVWGLRSFGK